jgi:hypothetical protein
MTASNNPNPNIMKKFILTYSCLILSLLANHAGATVITWDPQGTSGGTIVSPTSGGYTGSMSQTWENAEWSTSETGQATPQAWTEGSAALFAVQANGNTPAFTVTMNSNHTVAGFFNGPLTPDPCQVTINGTGIITLQPGNLNGFAVSGDTGDPGYLTLNVVLAGGVTAGVCPEDNSGQTYLNGVNTYSGGTYLGYSGNAYTSSILGFPI